MLAEYEGGDRRAAGMAGEDHAAGHEPFLQYSNSCRYIVRDVGGVVACADRLREAAGVSEAGNQDFFSVLEVTTIYQSYYVEAALTAYATNRTSRGG